MARRKRQKEQKDSTSFTVEQVLDQADEEDLTSCMVIGRNSKNQWVIKSTLWHPGFMHHLLNGVLFQLNVMENDALRREEILRAEENKASIDMREMEVDNPTYE